MNTRLRTSAICLIAVGALALPLAGCGDSSSSDDSNDDSTATAQKSYGAPPKDDSAPTTGGASAGSSTLALAADPSGAIAFDKTSLEAKSGKTTIDFTNESQVPHAVEIEGNGIEEETETVVGGKTTLTADLKPGTYEFYCPIGDHKEEGMKGTLTVK